MKKEKAEGRVFWVTGLSGSGKTTVATALTEKLRAQGSPVVLLDGDVLREVFGDAIGHDAKSRLDASLRYGRLCRMLSGQGVDVVCATISMFDETRSWNREHIPHYMEIYLRVPIDELKKRDSKQIYSRAERGELSHVVGLDVPCEEPKHPDIIIDNYKDMTPHGAVERILLKIHKVA